MSRNPDLIAENIGPDQFFSGFSLPEVFVEKSLTSLLDNAIVFLFLLLLLSTPLPYGSVQATPVFLIESVAILCFVLWLLKLRFCTDAKQLSRFRVAYQENEDARRKAPLMVRYNGLAKMLRILTFGKYPKKYGADHLVTSEPPGLLNPAYFSFLGYPVQKTGMEIILVLFLTVLFVQIIPLPALVVSLISPATAAIYHSSDPNSRRFFLTFSIDPFATISKICEYGAYFLLFVVAVNTIYKRKFLWAILLALLCSATFQSIYGLYESFSHQGHIFGYHKSNHVQVASGTFINSNHFASYLVILLGLILSVALKLKGQVLFYARTFVGRFLMFLNSQLLLCFSVLLLSLIGIIFSRSRAGVALIGVSLSILLFIYLHRMTPRFSMKMTIASLLAVIGLTVLMAAGPLRQKFEHLPVDVTAPTGRLQVWIDTIRIFRNFPITGTGAGTFGEIFPMYQSVFHSVYSHAHNDYLEILAETGISSIFLFFGICFYLARRLFRIMTRSRDGFAVIQVGAFCSLVAAIITSLIHFSFQIPAICVTTAILAAVFFVKYERRKPRTRSSVKKYK